MKHRLWSLDYQGHYLSALFALLLVLTGCDVAPREDAEISAVRAFHEKILSLGTAGVPRLEDIEALTPYISAAFRQRLLAARAAEDAARIRHGGTEPPMLQGSIFHSLFEGAHRIISVERDQKTGGYLVNLEYGVENAPAAEKTIWQDRAWLITENGQPRVDDLEFLGKWDFGSKGRLSLILENIGRDFFPKPDL